MIFQTPLGLLAASLHIDHCVLYRNIYSHQDFLTLQENLTSLGQWEAAVQMK